MKFYCTNCKEELPKERMEQYCSEECAKDLSIGELIELFMWHGVSLQITLDNGKKAIVDAIHRGKSYRTQYYTLEGALELMRDIIA